MTQMHDRALRHRRRRKRASRGTYCFEHMVSHELRGGLNPEWTVKTYNGHKVLARWLKTTDYPMVYFCRKIGKVHIWRGKLARVEFGQVIK